MYAVKRDKRAPSWARSVRYRLPAPNTRRPRTVAKRGDNYMCTSRTVTLTPISGSTIAEVDVAYSFQLSDLPGYTEFTSLFDQYRIRKVVVRFIPDITIATPASGTGNNVAYSAIDLDDSTADTITGIEQYGTCVVHNNVKPFSRIIYPKFAIAAYSGAFTSYAQSQGWVDCASASIQHYGLKVAFAQNSGNANTWRVSATYTVEMRGTR